MVYRDTIDFINAKPLNSILFFKLKDGLQSEVVSLSNDKRIIPDNDNNIICVHRNFTKNNTLNLSNNACLEFINIINCINNPCVDVMANDCVNKFD